MGTRSFADVPPTSATIAMNAYIFGYGGHSLVTPHTTLKQLWWTDERIQRKVTRSFVVSKLRGEERQFLDKPLAFGEGLTDDTYMEWILERAKRLFLILTVIGVPDQIFGCIDDTWDDEDLPIPLENVKSLDLSYDHDEALNNRFYEVQYLYLLRELHAGVHIDYGANEHIPMEYVNTLPPAVSLQNWDRVHFPGRPDEIYVRRKFALADKETGHSFLQSFEQDIQKARILHHQHIAGVWASYTSEGWGYTLSDFVGEHTLASFINHRMPAQLFRVPEENRPALLCEWMHCLSDALACLHYRGVAHAAVRPSNIIIDNHHRIAFSDVGTLRTFQRGKKLRRNETYDYAAPESQINRLPMAITMSPPLSSIGAFSRLRKPSSSSSSGSSGGSTSRSNSLCTTAATSQSSTPLSTQRSSSIRPVTVLSSLTPPPRSSCYTSRNFSRHIERTECPSNIASPPASPRSTCTPPRPSLLNLDFLRDLPESDPKMSDIYSLGCIFLDITTFILRGKLNDFVRFRSTRSYMSLMSNGTQARTRTDYSFHCNPDKINGWICVLEADSAKMPGAVYRGLPAILSLVKRMLMQNAAMRPTAQQVRDRLQEVLVDQCGLEMLCCAGREWIVPPPPEVFSPLRDPLSIAARSPPGTPPCVQSERAFNGCGVADRTSCRSCAVSHCLPRAAQHRRRSSASAAAAKLRSWRKAYIKAR